MSNVIHVNFGRRYQPGDIVEFTEGSANQGRRAKVLHTTSEGIVVNRQGGLITNSGAHTRYVAKVPWKDINRIRFICKGDGSE